jgi:uncharacterized protein (TIGR02145 family)
MRIRYVKLLAVTLLCSGLTQCNPNTVKDIDGNKYGIVKIGTQIWMKENLKTTRFRNGKLIGTTTPATLIIEDAISPEYQWAYGGEEGKVTVYGRLYTWFVATDSDHVCPTGWHVPSDTDWTILTGYLIKNGYDSGTGYEKMDIAKSLSSTSGWVEDDYPGSVGNNQKLNNKTGFTALPAGFRGEDGNFHALGHIGNWWSSTEAKGGYFQALAGISVNSPGGRQRTIYHDYCYVNSYSNNKKCGMSIRCVKDN